MDEKIFADQRDYGYVQYVGAYHQVELFVESSGYWE